MQGKTNDSNYSHSYDVNYLVTQKIIQQLNRGIIPWEKNWIGTGNVPFNRISRKPYSYFNQMLLIAPGEYASSKQWASLGGHLKDKAKYQYVVFCMPASEVRRRKESLYKGDDEENRKKVYHSVLRYYRVYPISQVVGVKALNADEFPDAVVPDDDADTIIAAYLNRERIGFFEENNGSQSYYDVKADAVTVPGKIQFRSTSAYYSTVFHELIHSTGHPKRLNRISRDNPAAYGSAVYSKEELAAEIGAATLLNIFHMETGNSLRNNAAYIQGWIKVLKQDTHCIVSAASRAQKAVDMILGIKKDETAENTAV